MRGGSGGSGMLRRLGGAWWGRGTQGYTRVPATARGVARRALRVTSRTPEFPSTDTRVPIAPHLCATRHSGHFQAHVLREFWPRVCIHSRGGAWADSRPALQRPAGGHMTVWTSHCVITRHSCAWYVPTLPCVPPPASDVRGRRRPAGVRRAPRQRLWTVTCCTRAHRCASSTSLRVSCRSTRSPHALLPREPYGWASRSPCRSRSHARAHPSQQL